MYIRLFVLSFVTLLLVGCKSKFEAIRSSQDPELVYKEADRYFKEGEWLKAQTLYELAIPYYRGKGEAESLYYNYAYTHYNLKEYILASHYFKSFANTFYNSEKREEAEFMSAYSHYELSPVYRLDQTYTEKAIDALQLFINAHPRSERVAEANKLIDEMRAKLEEKAFAQGQLYYDIGQYQSAKKSFEILLVDFPETDRAEEVRLLALKASYILAEKSIYDKKEERFQETVDAYNTFVKKHADSKKMKEATEIYKNAQAALKKIRV